MNQHDHEPVAVSVERVRELLGGEPLRRLVARLRKRMERGEPLGGNLQLSAATPAERAAIDRLLGRVPTQGKSLSIDLDRLTSVLAHARACTRLEDAVTVLVGPVSNRRAESQALALRWSQLWDSAASAIQDNQAALRWLDDLKSSGILKRICQHNLAAAAPMIEQAVNIVRQVPFPGVRLTELAAATNGNSHALDRGQGLAALVIRLAPQIDAAQHWRTSAARRDAWETLGVLCDEVSAPLLVLNLRADTRSLTGQALELHAAAGEPYRLSVRQLRRHPPEFSREVCGPEVHVCENPAVVDAAANRLGPACLPLVCTDGQPKSAARLLFEALGKAGIQLRYHGDFDWDGIRIGNWMCHRFATRPWRFSTGDYVSIASKEHSLKGAPVAAAWDAGLASLMANTGKCVHEEQVLDSLLADLKRNG